MSILLMGLWSPSQAADRADVVPGEMVLTGEGWKIEVLGRGMPLIENLTTGGACRVKFVGKGTTVVPQVKECPDELRDEVVPASKYWLFETQGDLTRIEFDVWYLVDGRGVTTHLGPTSLEVTGDELTRLELEPRKATLPMWPAGQTLAARCVATVALDRNTGEVSSVVVADTGCPSGYAGAVVEAGRSWSFAPITVNGVAVPLAFEATIRFSPPSDGAPATIDVTLPIPPGKQVAFEDTMPEARHLPNTPPKLKLRHKNYADVLVHEIGRLEAPPSSSARECDFLMQVNTGGRTWLWPERCPTDLQPALAASRQKWSIVAGRAGAGELYARFRGTWEVAADGSAVLRLPVKDIVGSPELPEGVRTFSAPETVTMVPPKMGRTPIPEEPIACTLDVTVSARGRAASVMPAVVTGQELPGGCPSEYLALAVKSASHWVWRPATVDGERFEAHTTVQVKFGGGL